jgi:2-pyrone-4,6-dicarboxylate lactonase
VTEQPGDCRPPDPAPRAPLHATPPGAVDTHAHIIGDPTRYPMVAGRSYTPPQAGVAAYRHLLDVLGLSHAVIVQPSFYGTDNRCTRDALRAAEGAWRGVAVVSPEVTPQELAALHADGFRGARINLLFGGGQPLEALEAVAARVAPLGWHLQLLVDIRTLPAMVARLQALPCDIVFDHLGHFPVDEGLADDAREAMFRLLDAGRCWVKLSGGYRLTRGSVPYAALRSWAGELVQRRPDRMVWGSDWPHTAFEGDMPNDGALLDGLRDWVSHEDTVRRILVDNPVALYGFGKS